MRGTKTRRDDARDDKRKGLPRALIPIYGIVFIDVLGLTILIPVLPFLAKNFGASPAVVGLLITTTAIGATLTSPLWGRLSDRVGRKWVLLISQGFSFVGYLLLAVAGDLTLVFVSRAIEGLGGGNLGVAQSYIADETSDANRSKAYALSAAAFGAGFVFGPILSGLLVGFGFAVPFFAAAALELLNATLTFFFLPNSKAGDAAKVRFGDILKSIRTKTMLNLLARQFLYIFSFTYFFTVFALYLDKALHYGAKESALLLALSGAIGAVVLVAGGDRLIERFGPRRVSEAGFVLSFIAYAMMYFVHGLASFIAILVVWAIGGSVLRPTLNTLIVAAAPENERGVILGFADSLNNAAMIFAPAAGGIVIGLDPQATGFLPALLIVAAFILGVFAHEPNDETAAVGTTG